MEKKTKAGEEADLEMRLYELSVHIDPSLGEEGSGEKFEKILTAISHKGGKVERSEKPFLQTLSYPIAKAGRGTKEWCRTSYFGWLAFEMTAPQMVLFEGEMKNNTDVLRFLIVSLTKEALTEMGKRKVERKEERSEDKASSEETSSPLPSVEEGTKTVSAEELDKKIEEMIA